MKCPKCNSDNPDTLKFCGECGTKLDLSDDAQISFTKTLETPVEEVEELKTPEPSEEMVEEDDDLFPSEDDDEDDWS